MKIVNFKKITIQNFLSIGDEPVVVDIVPGFHVITGKNIDKPDRRNAVGKSSIADALYFSVFGDTLRGIKKDMISNNITANGARVELDFEVILSTTHQYKIIRTLNPTKVQVFEDGIDVTRDSTSNTSKYICDIISATPAIFKNCIIMTINDTIPFMAKGKIEKRKFIEDIFGLEIFSSMINEVRKEYNEIKNEFDIQQIRLEEAKNSYNVYISQRDKILEDRAIKYERYVKRVEDNTQQYNNLRLELKDLQNTSMNDIQEVERSITKYEKALDVCDLKINNLSSKSAVIKSSLSQNIKTLNNIGTTEVICPTCLSEIKSSDIEHINAEKIKISNNITHLKSDLSSLTASIQKLTNTKQQIRNKIAEFNKKVNLSSSIKQQIESKKTQLVQINEWISELEGDIKSVESKDTELDNIIDITNKSVISLTSDTKDIRSQLSKLDIVKYIVSEEGVKSYIVGKLLDVLNSRMVHYLKRLDANSICIFNEYFEEEIVNEKNKVCSYFNFSGAERKAIDLACLFTFSDIRRMQGDVKYNISMYDELLDSSFDEKGITLATDILVDRVERLSECVFIISHRKESIKTATGDVIYLTKQGGVTTRRPFEEL